LVEAIWRLSVLVMAGRERVSMEAGMVVVGEDGGVLALERFFWVVWIEICSKVGWKIRRRLGSGFWKFLEIY
jgi:hypothetical protein